MFEVGEFKVKDLVFESIYKKYAYQFRKQYVRKIIKERTPKDLKEKAAELRKKLREAREKGDWNTYGKLTAQLKEIEEKIKKATPLEHQILNVVNEAHREEERKIRDYMKKIIPKEEIVIPVEKALEDQNPELVRFSVKVVLEGAGVGKGARGS